MNHPESEPTIDEVFIPGYRVVRLRLEDHHARHFEAVVLGEEDRRVQLMVSRRAEPEMRTWFGRIAAVLRRLDHPGVPRCLEVGDLEGWPYLVLSSLAGEDLVKLVRRRGPLPLNEAVPIIRAAAAIVDQAHERGIVHGDLHPQRILIDEGGQVAVAGFGEFPPPEGLVGHLHHLAPEQLLGAEHTNPHSDVYALAEVAVFLLTGRFAFEGPAAKWLPRKEQEWLSQNREHRANLPSVIESVLDVALAVQPGCRFPKAGEFALALAAGAAKTRGFEELLEALGSSWQQDRWNAASKLVETGQAERAGDRLIAVLLEVFTEQDEWDSGASQYALEVLNGLIPQTVSYLARLIKDPHGQGREWAVRALAAFTCDSSGPTAESERRRGAGIPVLIEALAVGVSEGNADIVEAAGKALGIIQCDRTSIFALLLKALENPAIETEAVRLLEELAPLPEPVLGVIGTMIERGDHSLVCVNLIDLLGRLGPSAAPAAPSVRRALHDRFMLARCAAVEALAAMIGSAAIPDLLEALKDEEVLVREQAAASLGGLGSEAHSALPNLHAALHDPEESVRRAVQEAVRAIGPFPGPGE